MDDLKNIILRISNDDFSYKAILILNNRLSGRVVSTLQPMAKRCGASPGETFVIQGLTSRTLNTILKSCGRQLRRLATKPH